MTTAHTAAAGSRTRACRRAASGGYTQWTIAARKAALDATPPRRWMPSAPRPATPSRASTARATDGVESVKEIPLQKKAMSSARTAGSFC